MKVVKIAFLTISLFFIMSCVKITEQKEPTNSNFIIDSLNNVVFMLKIPKDWIVSEKSLEHLSVSPSNKIKENLRFSQNLLIRITNNEDELTEITTVLDSYKNSILKDFNVIYIKDRQKITLGGTDYVLLESKLGLNELNLFSFSLFRLQSKKIFWINYVIEDKGMEEYKAERNRLMEIVNSFELIR